ncbi:hypothetical protein JTB14_016968 [Gonioctena quinquepunctata]|nr:hypothetical protein JTB14_016968 [Gonioctena quinquepunctata]
MVIFNEHIREQCGKAETQSTALTKILANMRGPSTQRKEATVWSGTVGLSIRRTDWKRVSGVGKYRKMLVSTQRNMFLGTISAHKTVFSDALCVIAGVSPIDMLVKERGLLDDLAEVTEDSKRQKRDRTVTEWQGSWENNNSTAQWTKRLVPDIEAWIKCTHR